MYDIEKIKQKVKELVNNERYNHCLLTGEAAIELAKQYSDDKVKNMINACLDKIYHQRLENE